MRKAAFILIGLGILVIVAGQICVFATRTRAARSGQHHDPA